MTSTTIVLPALHSPIADQPTVRLSLALLSHAITGHSGGWLTRDATTDVFLRAERRQRASDRLLPPPAPDARTCVTLLRPWRAWLRGCAVRRVRSRKRRELLHFLGWARSTALLLPSEIRESSLLAYRLWLAEEVLAGRLGRTVAKRRVAIARSALAWRDSERQAWLALEPAA